MVDEPLHFQGGLTKRSYFNKNGHVSINDKQALMHSSNVYMFKTALKISGRPLLFWYGFTFRYKFTCPKA